MVIELSGSSAIWTVIPNNITFQQCHPQLINFIEIIN
jgi:hypothetical protein